MKEIKGWVPGPVQTPGKAYKPPVSVKAMQFVLDCSGSMAGSYLSTCKTSAQMIVDEFTDSEDQVGFIAFAHYTKDIFPLMKKGGNENKIRQDISNLNTFGGTAFFDAVMDGLERLRSLPPDTPKWVIALTDGADQHSSRDKSGRQACDLLRKIPKSNLAIITVGDLPQSTIGNVKKYVAAAASVGNKALHIVASDASKIAEAFETIGNMMADDGGLAEHL
jgi:Mg-chelatase subunit ChlD